MIGRVVKGIGGFYFVHDGHQAVMGKARGILKRGREIIYVGDIVDYDIDDNDSDNECVINFVTERRNYLTRPPVSNLDILVVVFSLVNPEVNYPVVDKLLAGAERAGIMPVICISKKDLVSDEELEKAAVRFNDIYPVIFVNGSTGEGLDDLWEQIRGKNAALAGPSGVGKSTITNWLLVNHFTSQKNGQSIYEDYIYNKESNESDIGINTINTVETGTVSEKTGRGRHTTRHVEVFPLDGDTWLYDTPGFTSLELQGALPGEIGLVLPEIRELSSGCRYRNCMHINEPDCAVKDALADGRISRSRYESYRIMVDEAEAEQTKRRR